jgi:hypothetical protein
VFVVQNCPSCFLHNPLTQQLVALLHVWSLQVNIVVVVGVVVVVINVHILSIHS